MSVTDKMRRKVESLLDNLHTEMSLDIMSAFPVAPQNMALL